MSGLKTQADLVKTEEGEVGESKICLNLGGAIRDKEAGEKKTDGTADHHHTKKETLPPIAKTRILKHLFQDVPEINSF